MTDPHEDTIDPAPNATTSAEEIADEQLSHALLQGLFEAPEQTEVRVRRLMERIESAEVEDAAIPIQTSGAWAHRWRSSVGITSGLAAAVLVVLALVFLTGTQRSATATVHDSIAALHRAGDRTYSVLVKRHDSQDFVQRGDATLHVRNGDQYVCTMRAPEGHLVVAGRDAAGEWMVRRDGSITRTAPERHRPRWIDLGGESLLVASVDGLLAALPSAKRYTLELLEPEALLPHPSANLLFDHVRARPVDSSLPGPEQVDVWIHPQTRLLVRMDLKLGEPPHPPGREGGGPPPPRLGFPPRRGPPPHVRGPGQPGPPRAIRFEMEQTPTQLPDSLFDPNEYLKDPADTSPRQG